MLSCCKAGGELVAGAVKASKEDERNQKVVRNLLKHRDNGHCINCDNSGPRFVCMDFATFVCIICSGIHRELMHRVKSISISKFTPEEVMLLQDGGNKRAREIYFKEWDSRRHSVPNSRDIDKLREFIKIVYVEKRYMGVRSEISLRLKPIDQKEDYLQRNGSGSRNNRRPQSFEDTNSNNIRSLNDDERLGPGGDQKNNERNSRYGPGDQKNYDERNSRYGYNDERLTRSGTGDRKYHDERSGFGDQKNYDERNSRYSYNDERTSRGYDQDTTPKQGMFRRSFSQMLRDKIGPDRSSGNKKNEVSSVSEGDQKVEERLAEQQKIHSSSASLHVTSSGSPTLEDEDPTLQRCASSSSTESVTKKAVETKKEISKSMIVLDADPEPAPQKIKKIIVSTIKTESTSTTSSSDNNWASFGSSGGNAAAAAAAPASSSESTKKADAGLDLLLSLDLMPSSTIPGSGSQSTSAQQSLPSSNDFSNKESWILSLVSNPQESSSSPTFSSSQSVSSKIHDTSESESHSSDKKSGERQALPEYLFAGAYPSTPPYAVQSHRVVYGMQMQYTSVANMPAIHQQPQQANPFDMHNASTPIQNSMYPSMLPMQGTLPPQSSAQTVLIDPRSQQWLKTQSLPYAPVQQQFYTSRMSNGTYMEQQTHSGNQGVGRYGSEGPGFVILNTSQQTGVRVNGGNPFA